MTPKILCSSVSIIRYDYKRTEQWQKKPQSKLQYVKKLCFHSEFRTIFREVDTFIKTAEDILDTNAVTSLLGAQVQEWRQKKEELMELSRQVVEKRLGQKEDVEPGL